MQHCCVWDCANEALQINESGLKIFSIDDLQSAAEKSVQFSKLVKMGTSNTKPQKPLRMLRLGVNWLLARDIDVGVEFSLGI
jgi:succinyl-CoA synthetase beta subunit